jgi:hypothetical protein
MRTSRLSGLRSLAICFIAALSNPFYAYAGSANENGDKGTKTEPVTKGDPDCDHTNDLPSNRLFSSDVIIPTLGAGRNTISR